MTNEEAFKQFNEDLTTAILTDADFIKMIASGKTANFLVSPRSAEYRVDGFTKFGIYPVQQDKGRGPTRSQTGGLFTAIYDWLQYKKYGFKWTSPQERKSMAFAIVKKMSKEGSAKFRGQVPKTDIYNKAINKTLPILRENLVNVQRERVVNLFNEILK
jgi:hypothetical protein